MPSKGILGAGLKSKPCLPQIWKLLHYLIFPFSHVLYVAVFEEGRSRIPSNSGMRANDVWLSCPKNLCRDSLFTARHDFKASSKGEWLLSSGLLCWSLVTAYFGFWLCCCSLSWSPLRTLQFLNRVHSVRNSMLRLVWWFKGHTLTMLIWVKCMVAVLCAHLAAGLFFPVPLSRYLHCFAEIYCCPPLHSFCCCVCQYQHLGLLVVTKKIST